MTDGGAQPGAPMDAVAGKPACAATTQRGAPCRGLVPTGRTYCLVHDPEMADKVQEARRRGGTVAMKLRLLEGKRLKLDTPKALTKFISDLMQDVLGGSVQPDIARTVAYCASIQVRLVESATLEQRLSELEQRLNQQGGQKRWAS